VVIWLEQRTDCLHMVHLMPLLSQIPITSSLIQIQTAFTFLILAYPGCLEKRSFNGCSSSSSVIGTC